MWTLETGLPVVGWYLEVDVCDEHFGAFGEDPDGELVGEGSDDDGDVCCAVGNLSMVGNDEEILLKGELRAVKCLYLPGLSGPLGDIFYLHRG